MRRVLQPCVALMVAAALSCSSGSGDSAPDAAPSSSTPPPTPSAGAQESRIHKRFRLVVDHCDWTGHAFAAPCPPLAQLRRTRGVPVDDELLALLADDDPRMRYLSAQMLERTQPTKPVTDRKTAEALFSALNGARAPSMCLGVARYATMVMLTATGQEAAAKEVAERHPVPACRAELVRHLTTRNPQLYDFVVGLAANDADVGVRVAAREAMSHGARGHAERQKSNCRQWGLHLDKPGIDASMSANLLARQGLQRGETRCSEQWPLAVTAVQRWAEDGVAESDLAARAMCTLYQQPEVDEAVKSQALAAAETLVTNTKNGNAARATALKCLSRYHPKGKAIAARFSADASERVRRVALQVTDGVR